MNSNDTEAKATQSLLDICSDLFSFMLYMRAAHYPEPMDALYDRIVTLFTSIEEKARSAKIPDMDIWDAKYALVAFIDEAIGWESRLELEYFGSNVAGEEFFSKLDEIKQAKARDQVLEVYYVCLCLGFEGRYVRRPERLRSYIADFQQTLQSRGIERLSPHGQIPQESIRRRRGGIPAWVPWVFTLVCIAAVVVVFVILKIRINHWAAGVISRVRSVIL